MDKQNERFQEQDAPQKNTDNAFVKVGEDGRPEIPDRPKEEQHQTQTPAIKENES